MSREGSLIQTFVAMADTLVDDYDVIDVLTNLTDRCVSLLGASAAGVMIASPEGDLRLVASSSESMRVLEVFELQAQEGPCLDAFRTGERVEHETLRVGSGRWPRFSVAALDAGFASAFALPLRLRTVIVGALNLFDSEPTPMTEDNIAVAQGFADLASISILQYRAATEARQLNEQLSFALNSRIIIEQAKGVISERAGLDLPEAFARLRGYARDHNLRLTDIAQEAIDGTLTPQAWAARPAKQPRP